VDRPRRTRQAAPALRLLLIAPVPTLNWIGKEAVVNHHHQVPFHLLKDVPGLACGDPGSGNLIVQGDNLVALKALLPYYAGQVKCIYIDPPYNTGNEGWVYNDNVNSPLIRDWLGKAVGKEAEDLSRHDKWLCLMYPRLRIFKELLSRDGLLAVSIDDNEFSFLGVLLDEIFGAKNRLACAPWLAEPSGGKEKTGLRGGHEYLLIYHNGDDTNVSRETRSTGELDRKDKWGKYRKGRELTKWGGISLRKDRPGQWFPLRTPDGVEVWPIKNDGEEGHWRWGKEQKMKEIVADPECAHWELRSFDPGVTWEGKTERYVPYEKIRDSSKSIGWSTWLDSYGFNSDATRELKDIFGKKPFDTPKPIALIKWLVSLHADDDALVLDSFAGSGTTGHAVLQLNKEDGGNRRFILIEMESNIARDITAERIKRVAQGYTNAKGEPIERLGSGFRFCELGEPLFDEHGQVKPSVRFAELARHVYFTETGEPLPRERVLKSPLLGECRGVGIYLLFNGILGDKSANGGNILTRAVLAQLPKFAGQKVIYCAGCLLGKDRLEAEGITVRQTPYEIKVS
jgi:DNA modification methylase